MKYLSVCSGIEAATVAWHPLGFQPVAFAEIDAFPSAVLAYHYPAVQNRGDMTQFRNWPDATFDVLVGGTPCQSFSVAGLRAGLADPRGNLALTYLAVVDRCRPRWVVWENVPGVLSSDSHDAPDPRPPTVYMDGMHGPADGEEVVVEDEYDADESHAFACFLAGFSELGYGYAYRTLDAQYFGLAQRRARVFVVGHLGDWRRAAAVLFERESLSGHPPPSREAGQRLADTLTVGANQCSGRPSDFVETPDLAGTLGGASQSGGFRTTDLDNSGAFIPVAFQQPHVSHEMQVRRLTPRECERLQGFPDDYTLIPYRGKPAADGPRYKALGNSMAVPVMRWIGQRIQLVQTVLSEIQP